MTDYSYHRCAKCDLEFPDPQSNAYCLPGSGCNLPRDPDRPDPLRSDPREKRSGKRGTTTEAAKPAKVDRAALIRDLERADSDALVVSAAAWISWADRHEGEPCPDEQIPTPIELDAWLDTVPAYPITAALLADHSEDDMMHDLRAWLRWKFILAGEGEFIDAGPVDVHGTFRDMVTAGTAHWKDHPVIALVGAWQERPAVVEPNTRPDRILPATLGHVAGPIAARDVSRGSGALFTPAHYSAPGDDQLVMPGFERPDVFGPALPLALYTLGMDMKDPGHRGRGAPVALRLWIEAVLSAHLQGRSGPRVYRIPMGQLIQSLWPAQDLHNPYLARNFKRLWKARDALVTRRAMVPYTDEHGNQNLMTVVSIPSLPSEATALNSDVWIEVRLPPGAHRGPILPPALNAWGANSAGAYAALINLAYAWHDPGRTLVPSEKGKRPGIPWVYQLKDESRWPIYDAAAITRLCFPHAEIPTRHARFFHARAVTALRSLEAAGGVEIKGDIEGRDPVQLLPPTKHGNMNLDPPG